MESQTGFHYRLLLFLSPPALFISVSTSPSQSCSCYYSLVIISPIFSLNVFFLSFVVFPIIMWLYGWCVQVGAHNYAHSNNLQRIQMRNICIVLVKQTQIYTFLYIFFNSVVLATAVVLLFCRYNCNFFGFFIYL